MAMTTGNEDEVKVDEDTMIETSDSAAGNPVKVTRKKNETVEVKQDTPEKDYVSKSREEVGTFDYTYSSPKVCPTKAAVVFLAQRVLDAPGFEDFKMLYPGMFE